MATMDDAQPHGTTPYEEAKLTALLKDCKAFKTRFNALVDADDVVPSSPNLHFARMELRNSYLKLLFHFTFSSRVNAVELIWNETSYPLVHMYRSQLTGIEAKMKELETAATKVSGTSSSHKAQHSKKKSVAKQAQLTQTHANHAAAFRAFLETEEAFWCDLVARIATLYDVNETYPSLRALQILTDASEVPPPRDNVESAGMDRIVRRDDGETRAKGKERAQNLASRRRLLELIHKSLIYCGDLARYRALYQRDNVSDHAGSPAGVQSDASNIRGGRGGRGRGRARGRGGMQQQQQQQALAGHTKKSRDFTRAEQCYDQARQLLPTEGNAWNQLAVLSTYRGESFPAVYLYYRAICVKAPFSKATENLERILKKTQNKWEVRGQHDLYLETTKSQNSHADDGIPRLWEVMDDFTVLHCTFYTRNEEFLFSPFPQHCVQSYARLLQQKALHTDVVVQILVTSISALWIRRLWRGSSPKSEENGTASSIVTEHSILLHLCGLIHVLFDLGARETADAIAHVRDNPPTAPRGATDGGHSQHAARHITAVVRRMLPAVRIASKWLKSHLEYVQRARRSPRAESLEGAMAETSLGTTSSAKAQRSLALGVDRMWTDYTHFINIVRFAFPFDSLPSIGMSVGQSGMTSLDFEEDRDMLGFAPMKKSTLVQDATPSAGKGALAGTSATSALHPNEEHLIRIADILIDAKVIAETDSSPVHFDDAKNSFYFHKPADSQLDAAATESEPVLADAQGVQSTDSTATRPFLDDEEWQNASESSEDAVDLAMRAVDERRHALDIGSDDEEEADAAATDGQPTTEVGDDAEDEEDEIILIPATRRGVASVATKTMAQPLDVSSGHIGGAAQGQSPNGDLFMSRKDVRSTRQDDNVQMENSLAQQMFLQALNCTPSSRTDDLHQAGSRPGSVSGVSSTAQSAPSYGAIGSPLAPIGGTSSPTSASRAYSPNIASGLWGGSGAGMLEGQRHIWAPPSPAAGIASQAGLPNVPLASPMHGAHPAGLTPSGWPTALGSGHNSPSQQQQHQQQPRNNSFGGLNNGVRDAIW